MGEPALQLPNPRLMVHLKGLLVRKASDGVAFDHFWLFLDAQYLSHKARHTWEIPVRLVTCGEFIDLPDMVDLNPL